MIQCAHCGMTNNDLRAEYPQQAKITSDNAYGLPVGKVFLWARLQEGDTSPYPIVIRGSWPDYFHGREYQMRADEATLIDPPTPPSLGSLAPWHGR